MTKKLDPKEPKITKVPLFKKSFQDIVAEGARLKENPPEDLDIDLSTVSDEDFIKKLEEPIEEVKVDEKKEEPTELEEKTKEVKEDRRREREEKIAEEAATKAAEKVSEKFKEQVKSEEPETKVEKKERKSKWQEEGRMPKDYDEIYLEAKEAAKQEALEEMESRLSAKQAEAERVANEARTVEEQKAAQQKAYEEFVNKQIDEEVEELYANDKLPKIKDENDPNDEGKVAKALLFKTAMDVNAERGKKGLAPITSIARIYSNYYKAPAKVAGADAPVMGNASPSVEAEPSINYADVHNKSFTQLAMESARKLMGKK